MQLNKDFREFIELLNSNGVEYLVVGAFAVAWHGHPRFTADIDFLIRASSANAEHILNTLTEFGFGSLQISVEDLNRPNQVVQLGVIPNRIDIITSIDGVEFEQAWRRRVTGEIDGISVSIIGLEDLLRNKEATGRLKDAGDAEQLRKQRTDQLE